MNRLWAILLGISLPLHVLADVTPKPGSGLKCAMSTYECSSGPETRIIDGMKVHRDCWEWNVQYACIQPPVTQTCDSIVSRGGVLLGSSCVQGVTIDGEFHCVEESREYKFIKKTEGSSTQTDCGGQQYCLDGNCFDVGSSPDQDFKKAVTGMEAMREAGAYMEEGTLRLFKGQDNRCGKNVVQNCCTGTDKKVGGLTNKEIMSGGNPYTFDSLGNGVGRSNLYGIPGFDPVAFSLSMSMAVVSEMLKCDKSEVLLAVKRQKSLCHHVGEYCSKQIKVGLAKICIQRKETYCCFNSKIARIINEHARMTLPGLTWGSPEAPSCNGISIEQFQSLDLSAVDFSEVYDDIVPKMPDEAATSGATETKVKCYFAEEC
jgi:conjugal transfer mating pair stabilization protein TraN